VSLDPSQRSAAAFNRLAKWRAWFAGWHLGTQPSSHGPTRAFRNLYESTLIMRAELSAMSQILISKGVYTLDEWREAAAGEADRLSELLTDKFPGVRATDDGLSMAPHIAAATMRREGFPP
jgi:hypothetical protein